MYGDLIWGGASGVGEVCCEIVYTFVRCPLYTLHNGSPLHHIVVRGSEFEKRIVGVVLQCLEFGHEALDGRCVAR
jgi:hypothetical protein